MRLIAGWPVRLRHIAACILLLAIAIPSFGQDDEKHTKEKEEKDDPHARQQYLEELRGGGPDGFVPPGARLKALQEMDNLVREEGQRYWQMRSQASTQKTTATGTGTSSSAGQETSIANGSPTSSQWLFIGPRPTNGFMKSSGRTTAIVVDPNVPTTVYVGGAQGGAWKSTDSGANWTPLMDGPGIPSLAVGSMAIDGSANPSTVYVGTGEQGSAFDSYYGAGVLKSADGGTTWTQLGAGVFAGPFSCSNTSTGFGFSCGGAFIGGLSVRPGGANPATLLAAVSLPSGISSGSGIYRTTDGGATWTRVLSGSTSLGATSVQYATANIAYAGLDSLGVYRSNDGGASWVQVNGNGTLTPGGRIELSVALSDTSGLTVYATVGTSDGDLIGLFKTTDGGLTWTKQTALTDYCTPQCWYDNVVAVNPQNANVVFVGGSAVTGHLSKTINGGGSWTAATSAIHVDHHAAAFTPDGSKLYWGNDGGVYSTTDTTTASATAAWTNLNSNLGLTQFYANFALHPTDINIAFGGTQDNGTQRYDGTQDLSLAWNNTGFCGDGAGNVIDASNPSIVYTNCQNIDIGKSTNGGLSGFSSIDSTITSSDRVLFIPPLVGDNFSGGSNNVYFGTFRVWQTRNQGASWQAISISLATNKITRLAVAPSDRSIMYVSSDDGKVWRGERLLDAAPNDCATLLNCFTEITSDLLPAARRINALAVSPFDAMTVYVGHGGFGSTTRHLSRSTGGGSWVDITGNLPNTPIQDIVVDPDIPGTIYVATDIGVFISTNDGATWGTLANGLPRLAVYGLKLHRASRTLRAATHGRGFWDLAVPTTVVGAGGILLPSSLSFGLRPVGSPSAPKLISFVNNGSSPTTIGTVLISGNFYLSSNGCVGTLAPSASCNIGIIFNPPTTGLHNGSVSVASNAASSPAVGGLSGIGGPPNDNFASAVVVNSPNFTHSTSTLGATTEGSDPTPSCLLGSPVSKTVWYSYTPGANGQAVINTRGSNYDTVLAVFTGTQGALAEVINGCNDDIGNVAESPSEVTVNVVAGTTYRIMVMGFVPKDGGELVFNLNGPGPIILTPPVVDVNAVVGRTAAPQTVNFFNGSGAAITINTISVTGDYTATHNCPLGASAFVNATSCSISVTFSPAGAGVRNGQLTIVTSAGTRVVALNGTGVEFTLSLTRPMRPTRGSGSAIVI
ncbi:MAG TPA: choice-of-anchor D domain-containing protein, partial [Terriglobales bacterium]|nr:choice-of-anchor D domain-containing protein [Terriglobales bacterium]